MINVTPRKNETHMEMMVREINDRIKPVKRKITIGSREFEVELKGDVARMAGPEAVRISHNKNSVTIGEMYPNLKELIHA